MNIQIADRLIQLRKDKGLSQEALAEQLGISRQAISKWERAEASPDTDNLIALASLYGMTLDQLLDTSKDTYKVGNVNKEKVKKEKQPLNETQKKGKKLMAAFPIVTFAIVAVYVVLGFALKIWSPTWILFLVIPLFFTYALSLLMGRTKRVVALALTSTVALAAVSIFLILGMLLDLWAVAWVVFLVIPVYAYVAFLKTKPANKDE